MRLGLFALFILALGACSEGNKNQDKNLNGTWVSVEQEMGGNPPQTMFANEKLTISDSSYTMVAESTDKGTVKVSGKQMDIYGREAVNAGKHFKAIYKYEDGKLTICYDLTGEKYPEKFDTQGQPMFFRSVFKKL